MTRHRPNRATDAPSRPPTAPSPLTVAAGVQRPRAAAPPAPAARRPRPTVAESVTGAQALVRSLESLGVEVMFGIPGGAILPAYDPIFDSTVRHILVRHEQGGRARRHRLRAGHRQGRRLHGHLGPGRDQPGHADRRRLHGLGRRWSRSPARCPAASIGSDAFQEADIHGITLPITKHNYLVTAAEDLPRIMAEAFHLAGTGRPGPVLVDIPKDVLQARTEFSWPPTMELPGYRPTLQPHGKQIREAARLIAMARRPVLYVGGGVLKAGASAVLRSWPS